jgi:hypothetical protein
MSAFFPFGFGCFELKFSQKQTKRKRQPACVGGQDPERLPVHQGVSLTNKRAQSRSIKTARFQKILKTGNLRFGRPLFGFEKFQSNERTKLKVSFLMELTVSFLYFPERACSRSKPSTHAHKTQ